MDDELEDCDYDIDLGNEDEDALLADDFQDSGRYDQSVEDVLDLNPENDLECELLTPNVSKQYNADTEASFDRTQEEETDTSRQENFETSHAEDSFNVLHDESDEEDKDNSNRDRFKSERSQILPPTSSNTIPDSLENVMARLPPPEPPRDRWQHGRRGKRGSGGRPMGQIRPSFRPPFTPSYQNRGNQNQRGGHRPRFQHRGGNNGGGNVPNPPASKKILINPHFQGAVQPLPGSGRLVWDTAILQDPPTNTFQSPAVDLFQQNRPEEQAPWAYQEQPVPSPWLEGFGPGTEPNAHVQQQQLQHHQQNHHQNIQMHHQPDMRYQQPNNFPAQPFPQPGLFPQPFGPNEMEMEQVRFHEQRRINQERQHLNQLDEERQREAEYQNRWDETQRHEMVRMEDPMAPSAQNYDRRTAFARNTDNFDRHERGMQEGPSRIYATQPHFSGPPPPNADFYPRPSACDSRDLFPNPSRQGPPNQRGLPLFTQPPPTLPLGQHNQGPPLLNNLPPMHSQGQPGFDRPQHLNSTVIHNNAPGLHHHQQPFQSPAHSSQGVDRPSPFRTQVPQLPYRTPAAVRILQSQPDFAERPAISRPLLQKTQPQLLPTSSFVQSARNQPQTNERNQQQIMQHRNPAVQAGRQEMQTRLAAEPNRRVVMPKNLQQVRTANPSLRTNLQQVPSIDMNRATLQRTHSYQDQETRAPRQQIAGPPIRQKVPTIRSQTVSMRHPGPPMQQRGPPIRQPGPGIRQHRPPLRPQGPSVVHNPGPSIRQQRPSIRQQGPLIRQQGLKQPSNQKLSQVQAKAGPALHLISASKRQLAAAEEDSKRAKLAVQEPVEEAEDEYLEEAVDEDEDAELRDYRKQIAKQKKIRDAVFLAKEARRKEAARERLLAQENQQLEDGLNEDHVVIPVGEAIATIVNRNPVEPNLPMTQRKVVHLGQKGHPRR